MTVTARLTRDPIWVEDWIERVRGDGDGAVSLFVGTVRNENAGERVRFLEYEAYESMAEPEMARIASVAVDRFGVSSVAVVHRVGKLDVGDASITIAVAAPHRRDAIEACRWILDTVKRSVPIWKREHGVGGVVWIEGAGRVPARTDPGSGPD